jgi:amino acid adenylation domain-containing protein
MKQGFVHQVFSQLAEEDGDRLAIDDNRGTRVTYGQLEESANRLASYLLSEVGSGSVVAIITEDTVTVITAILASLKAGCIFVPLDPRLPRKRLEMLMAQVEPAICLYDLETVNGNHVGPTPPQITSAPDAMCYIYFTSGSTGRPKGIAGRLKAIDHFVRWEIETLGLREGVRVSQFTNPSFDAYLRDTFVPLCAGGTVCVRPDFGDGLDGPQLVKWIDDSRINLIHCVPSLFRALVHEDLHPEHFPFLKHILLSGEPLLPADVKRWMSIFGERIRLVNLYGPTETTMVKFFHFVTAADQDRRAIPIGKPIAGTKAIVVDAQGKACPVGTVGEIYIRTPYSSLGYFKQPELTSEVFVPNPFSNKSNDIVYKTGDLARVLEDGSFEFLGRKDRQVKIRGIRVELSEIEDLLLGHEAVKDVVVVDREDTSGNKYLCAYVVMSGEVMQGALRDYLSEHVPGYLVPSAFVTLETLPRTATGKVDRSALPAVGQDVKRAFIAPRTETEQALADIWVQVLGVERIGVDDSFFELGGHSLLATQVTSRIRLIFHIEISLRAMFESPTLRGLAAKIDQARASSDEEIAGLLDSLEQLSADEAKAKLKELSLAGDL